MNTNQDISMIETRDTSLTSESVLLNRCANNGCLQPETTLFVMQYYSRIKYALNWNTRKFTVWTLSVSLCSYFYIFWLYIIVNTRNPLFLLCSLLTSCLFICLSGIQRVFHKIHTSLLDIQHTFCCIWHQGARGIHLGSSKNGTKNIL